MSSLSCQRYFAQLRAADGDALRFTSGPCANGSAGACPTPRDGVKNTGMTRCPPSARHSIRSFGATTSITDAQPTTSNSGSSIGRSVVPGGNG